MKNKTNKHSGNSFKKDLALMGRGYKLLWEIHPAHMIWFTVYTVFRCYVRACGDRSWTLRSLLVYGEKESRMARSGARAYLA